MQIIDNRALHLRLKDPERVLSVIPKSHVLREENGRADVLVHWGFEEAMVLRNLGIRNVPSPIIGRYKWPGMYKPMQHQRTTAGFLTMNKRAYCFNEQGTGKTLSVAWAADYLMSRKIIKRVLVICPLSTMQTTWQADLFKSVMHRKVGIAYGDRQKRIRVINSDVEFVIINTDGVGVVAKELARAKFDLVVIDEATSVKTASTARWKAINSLVRPDTWLWMLTGTPAAQTPLDAYGLARMMNPATAPRSFNVWRDEVMLKVSMFKWVPKNGWRDKVFDLLQPAIRFTKDECLDLPPITYVTREVQMTKQQQRVYDAVRQQMSVEAAGQTITAVNAAAGVSKLLQISSASVYTDDGETVELDMRPRYNELMSIIEESSQKVLVFVPFTNMIDRLGEQLNADGVTTEVIDGRVSAGKRADIISRFQMEPEGTKVLVMQPQAVSHGITLHAANISVWWGPVMSYETYAQANARMHRKGQHHPCTVVHLQASPAEAMRFKALANMSDDQESLLAMYRELLRG